MLIRRTKPSGDTPTQQVNGVAAPANTNNLAVPPGKGLALPPPSSTLSTSSTKLPPPPSSLQLGQTNVNAGSQQQQNQNQQVTGLQLPPQHLPQGLPPGRFVGAPPGQLPPGGKFIHPSQMPPSSIPPGKVIPLTGAGGTASQSTAPPLPRNNNNISSNNNNASTKNVAVASQQQQQQQQEQQQQQQSQIAQQVGQTPQNQIRPQDQSQQQNHNYYQPTAVQSQEFRQASPPPRPARRIPQGTETLDLSTQPDDIKLLHKRLTNYFSHYSPYLVRQVDHLILQYADREAELWKSLETKYGPEPPFPEEGMDVRSRLIRFFRRYDTSYEGQVDKVLDTYAGHHDLMWKSLTNRFGPEPDIPSRFAKKKEVPMDLASRLERFFKNNDEKRIVKIDELMITYKDREVDLRDMLKQLYDDELEAPTGSGWSKLEKERKQKQDEIERKKKEEIIISASRAGSLQQQQLQAKSSSNDDFSSSSNNNAGSGQQQQQQQKDESSKSPSPARPAVSVLDRIDARKKLTNYLHHLSPEREAMMDDILDNFAGEEKQVVQTVEKIFGPVDELAKKRQQQEEEDRKKRSLDQNAAMLRQQQQQQNVEMEKKRNLDVLDQQQRLQQKSPSDAISSSSATATSASSHKERLVKYYSRVAPAKLETVDVILQKYQGREDDMWGMLENKYGPENEIATAPQQQAAATTSTTTIPTPASSSFQNSTCPPPPGLDYKQRLINLFTFYHKAGDTQLANVDESLERYKGKEEMMFTLLVGKFGPEPWVDEKTGQLIPNPHASQELQQQQREIFKQKQADELALSQQQQKQQAAAAAVIVTSSSSSSSSVPVVVQSQQPTSSNLDWRTRIFRYYSIHDPVKANDEQIEKVLTKYRDRENVLMEMLTDKFAAPEPTEAEWQIHLDKQQQKQQQQVPAVQGVSTSSPVVVSKQVYHDRLMRFYQKYDVSKATDAQAEKVLTKYEGAEEALFDMLRAKYGPEPDVNSNNNNNNNASAVVTNNQNQNSSSIINSPYPSGQEQQQELPQNQSINNKSHAERLMKFYQFYDPAKANQDQIDQVLTKYAGNEAKLWNMLEDKFGPESAAIAAEQSSKQSQQQQSAPSQLSSSTFNTTTTTNNNINSNPHRDRLMAFYLKHEPLKANDEQISKVLTKYAGDEATLFQMLDDKYGVNANANNSNNNISNNNNVSGTSSSTPQPQANNLADRLLKFYRKVDPAKANKEQVEKVMTKYAGQEQILLEMLEAKYNVPVD